MQHASHHLHDVSIPSFTNTVLLWCVRSSELMNDANFLTIEIELWWGILLAIIRPNGLNSVIAYVFHILLEFEKNPSNFWFVFHEENPAHPRKVINKKNIVSATFDWRCAEWTSNISVNQLEFLCRSPSWFLEWLSALFTKLTCTAIWWKVSEFRHSSYRVMFLHAYHPLLMAVA